MTYDRLVCANCAAPVSEGRCPVCRANRERLQQENHPFAGLNPMALIALLARIGSFVPASRARIGKIDRIFTRIGAADDLAGARARLEALDAEYPATYWQLSIVPPLIEVLMAQEDWDPAEDLADALAQSVEGTPNGAVYWLKKAHIQHLADRNLAADRTLALLAGRYKGAPYVTLALQQRAVLAALTAPPAAPNAP